MNPPPARPGLTRAPSSRDSPHTAPGRLIPWKGIPLCLKSTALTTRVNSVDQVLSAARLTEGDG
jgi:hypothetical protein